jgi:hypothetical protein
MARWWGTHQPAVRGSLGRQERYFFATMIIVGLNRGII